MTCHGRKRSSTRQISLYYILHDCRKLESYVMGIYAYKASSRPDGIQPFVPAARNLVQCRRRSPVRLLIVLRIVWTSETGWSVFFSEKNIYHENIIPTVVQSDDPKTVKADTTFALRRRTQRSELPAPLVARAALVVAALRRFSTAAIEVYLNAGLMISFQSQWICHVQLADTVSLGIPRSDLRGRDE